MNLETTPASGSASRRDFIKTGTSLAAAAGLTSTLSRSVHAAQDSKIRVALIGCGGRGTGAASQALRADKETELVAMGDMFKDRAEGSVSQLKRDAEIAGRVNVSPDSIFTGFDAYKKVLAAGVDVVLLASPPGFRPAHIAAAIEAGKNIALANKETLVLKAEMLKRTQAQIEDLLNGLKAIEAARLCAATLVKRSKDFFRDVVVARPVRSGVVAGTVRK